MGGITHNQMKRFVAESWLIEGYDLRLSGKGYGAGPEKVLNLITAYHQEFMGLPSIRLVDLTDAAAFFTKNYGRLRNQYGLDVSIGEHTPPKGGPELADSVRSLCRLVNQNDTSPFEIHQRIEHLHPFMDGNGRTGRMLWAWCMLRWGQDGFWMTREFPFLQTWYYQSLDHMGT